MWCVSTHNRTLFSLKKGYLFILTTWMNLEDITLSEIIQLSKDNTICFYLNEVPRIVKFTQTESRMVVARD